MAGTKTVEALQELNRKDQENVKVGKTATFPTEVANKLIEKGAAKNVEADKSCKIGYLLYILKMKIV